jgi:polar amino acid transport system substrate-binding protein
MRRSRPGFLVNVSLGVILKDSPRRNLRFALIAATAAGALVLSACGSSSSSDSSSTSAAAGGATVSASSGPDVDAAKAALVEPGSLTMCTQLSYKPFEFTDGDQVVGFDVDLVDLAAAKLGVTTKVIDTPFEGIKSGEVTATGKCDLSAAGMTINDERSKVILVSVPYFDATQAMVVLDASTATTLADLKGKRVAGQTGTTGLEYLKKNADANGYEIVEYADFPSESDSLLTGQVDAAVQDLPVWNQFVADNAGKVKVAAQFNTGEQYGIGMKLGNTSLATVVNDAITEAKADGTYEALFAKWGFPPPASSSAGASSAAPSSN